MHTGSISSIKENLVGKKREAPWGDCVEMWSPRVGLVKEKCVLRMMETKMAKVGGR